MFAFSDPISRKCVAELMPVPKGALVLRFETRFGGTAGEQTSSASSAACRFKPAQKENR